MERSIAVNHHMSYYTENEKHTTQDLSNSHLTAGDQGIGDDVENSHRSGLIEETDTPKANIKRLDCMGGGHEAFCKTVGRAVNFGHRGDVGAGKTDDVKMKLAGVTKKCGKESATAGAGGGVKKRSSRRTRSDAIKINCRLVTIEIPNVVAELITTMDGCLCQYICKKANIHSMTVSFMYGKSNGQKLYIYGNENGMKHAIKLLKQIISKTARAKNTVFVRPN